MDVKDLSIESIENKILSIFNGRKYIDISDIEGYLEKIEVIYMIVNIYKFKRIMFTNIDTTKFIQIDDYVIPYMEIYKVNFITWGVYV